MARGRAFAPKMGQGSVLTPLNKPVEIRMMVTQEQAFAMKRIALSVDKLSYLVSEAGALLTALMKMGGWDEVHFTDATLDELGPLIPRLMREPRPAEHGGGVRIFFAPEEPEDGTGQAEPA